MSLGPKCKTCEARQSVVAVFLAGRWRKIVCPNCKSVLEEAAVAVSLRVGVTILLGGLVTNFIRHTQGLSRIELVVVGILAALTVWLATIPLTRLKKLESD